MFRHLRVAHDPEDIRPFTDEGLAPLLSVEDGSVLPAATEKALQLFREVGASNVTASRGECLVPHQPLGGVEQDLIDADEAEQAAGKASRGHGGKGLSWGLYRAHVLPQFFALAGTP